MIKPIDSAIQMVAIEPTLKASLVKTIVTKSEGQSSLFISNDLLFLGCSNLKVKIFSLNNFQEIQTMTAYSSKVQCMWVAQNYLFSGQEGEQGIIKVWDTNTYNLIRVLKGHTDTIQMITGLHKNQVFSASSDGSVRGWDISKADQIVYKLQHQYPVLVVQCINEKLLVSGGDGCLLIIWDWFKQQKLKTLFSHACSLTCLVLRGKQLITAGGDGKVRFWNIDQLIDQNSSHEFNDESNKSEIKISDNSIQYCCLFKQQIIMIDDDNRMFVINNHNFEQVQINIPYYEMVTGVSTIGDNRVILTTNNSDAKIYQIKSKKQVLFQ